MKISILGTGWFGRALACSLVKDGFEVNGSVTTPNKIEPLEREGIKGYLVELGDKPLDSHSKFWDCDALIIASNVRLASNTHYTEGIRQLIKLIQAKDIKQTIFISSTGVYGDENRIVDESTPCVPESSSGRILLGLESLFRQLPRGRATSMRFGGLVGPGRMPGSFFAGKKDIPNGEAPVNLIHLEDCIGITKCLLKSKHLPPVINAVSPDHPVKMNFYTLAAEVQSLPIPEFIHERSSWKVVQSRYRAAIGYDYRISDWNAWLRGLR